MSKKRSILRYDMKKNGSALSISTNYQANQWLPLTGQEVVDMIVTELAVIDVTPEGLVLREVAPGVTPEAVQKLTEPKLKVSPNLKTISV